MPKRIVIIGAGPTGIGAAYRLHELGYQNWTLYELCDYVGGHASSHTDEKGFIWDEGGHVIFSHYDYFDRFLDETLGLNYLEHERQSWIRLLNSWIPYPFQNNIRHLPKHALMECIMGLIEANHNSKAKHAKNFGEWTQAIFGAGINRYFMEPYNLKVWAFPLEQMTKDWMAERVSTVDIERVLHNVIYEIDDVSWGPNSKFKFPLNGGTGEIYRQAAKLFERNIKCGKKLVEVDHKRKEIRFEDGSGDSYDSIVTTMPLDQFVNLVVPSESALVEVARRLEHNGIFIVGIGLGKRIETNRCWLYFPENSCPFYRVTYFHKYSPNNVPGGNVDKYSSLMCEISYSPFKPVDADSVVTRTIEGLINSGVLTPDDQNKIVSYYLHDSPYAYPVPTIRRDSALNVIQPFLMKHDIYSRGRFGAWRYEIGNMDHSVMQGVEAVNQILTGDSEKVWSSL